MFEFLIFFIFHEINYSSIKICTPPKVQHIPPIEGYKHPVRHCQWIRLRYFLWKTYRWRNIWHACQQKLGRVHIQNIRRFVQNWNANDARHSCWRTETSASQTRKLRLQEIRPKGCKKTSSHCWSHHWQQHRLRQFSFGQIR